MLFSNKMFMLTSMHEAMSTSLSSICRISLSSFLTYAQNRKLNLGWILDVLWNFLQQSQKIKVFFKRTLEEHEFWRIEGEVHIRKALILTNKRRFRLRVNSNFGEVTYYKEARL